MARPLRYEAAGAFYLSDRNARDESGSRDEMDARRLLPRMEPSAAAYDYSEKWSWALVGLLGLRDD